MSIETWEHFFKPEVRGSGQSYFKKGVVRSFQPSDTEIQAFIRSSGNYKVSLKSPSVESPLVLADCTCPASQKGQYCKHMWATLLKVEESHSDFLDGKSEIQKQSPDQAAPSETKSNSAPNAKTGFKKPLSEQQVERQEAYKRKQSNYRKEQYQKQKQRLKDIKQAGKKSKFEPVPEFPEDVEEALAFFNQNGFEMKETLNAEIVRLAKKQLSRVFHPDKGGDHNEILELNRNADILMSFLENR